MHVEISGASVLSLTACLIAAVERETSHKHRYVFKAAPSGESDWSCPNAHALQENTVGLLTAIEQDRNPISRQIGAVYPRLDTPLCLGCKSRVPFALAAESRTAIEAAGSVLSVIVKEPGR